MSHNGAQKRILVVEDDALIRLLIEDMLDDLGFAVAARAAKVDEALSAISATNPDLAILDVNLNGETTGGVAEALASRGTPFVFATGYGLQGLPEKFRDRPIVNKPFQLDSLKRTLDAALAGAG